MITVLFGLLSAFSATLVFFGGTLFAGGQDGLAFLTTAVGAGWLGILYSSLLRHFHPERSCLPQNLSGNERSPM